MKGTFIYYDNKICEDHEIKTLMNRALFYGESVFTSLLIFEGRPFFLEDHLSRLFKGSTFIFGSDLVTPHLRKKITNDLEYFLSQLEYKKGRYVRIALFLEGPCQGLIPSHKGVLNFFIWENSLGENNFVLKKVNLCLAFKKRVPGLIPPYLKMGHYGETILELKRAKQNEFDDVLFVDTQKNMKECSTSNIFLRVGDHFFTPKIDSCLLEGITRKYFIQFLRESGMIVLEEDIDLSKVSSAQSIFLTSSIKLLQNVNSIEGNFWEFDKKYKNDVDLIYKRFKNFCTERSLEGMINYGKEKKSGRMSSM